MKRKSRNILLTCAGGAGTLSLANCLKENYRVFLADGNGHVAARFAGFPFRTIPFGGDPSFLGTMRALVEEWEIDYVVPGADEELLPFATLQEDGITKIIAPRRTFTETCLNKKKLMRALHESGISSIASYDTVEDVRYPAIVKPVYGRGSREVHQIRSKEQLEGYLKLYQKTMGDVVVQPFIEGCEYTVSVIVNNRNAVIGVVPKRIIEKRGITRSAVSESNPIIAGVCMRIVRELQPHGPFNAQLILKDRRCHIFEINPRLSTTAVLTERAFGNEVDLCIRFENEPKPSSVPTMLEGITLYRYEEHLFMKGERPLRPCE